MNWYKIYKKAQVYNYGMWISPSGKSCEVSSGDGHEVVAYKILKSMGYKKKVFDCTDSLLEEGFVRFIYYPFCAESTNHLTSSQKVKLMREVNESYVESYTFDFRESGIKETVYDKISARNLIRSN